MPNKILGVGIATLDIINTVDHFPQEDEEMRAIAQRICRGGNVSNTLTVLSQLGHQCYWAGVTCNDSDLAFILSDLQRHNIDYSFCENIPSGKMPTSYITLNKQNGSRTIIHYRNLPELSVTHFKTIPLASFDWIHFEARQILENLEMIQWLKKISSEITVSIEIEKKRIGYEKILDVADLYLYSKHFANTLGFDQAEAFLQHQQTFQKECDLVCGWGEQGAYVLTKENQLIHQPAIQQENIIDTIGAGDTLNAGIIHSRLMQKKWPQSLEFACTLASRKCAQAGFENLVI